ncbi:MAG TPA: hypothetical protein VEK06_05080 [Myxococcota bacterium]|nr:hypothetical protein [Myxococcota bacterium]
MSKVLLIFGCALALGIVTGATTHIKQQSSKEKAIELIIPSKCVESTREPASNFDCSKTPTIKDSRTGELFLRKVKRAPRRLLA